jgi:glycosyltransferase involved in cell wall biosynthesis
MPMTRVDVVVTSYNYGDMLEASVRSVLAQEGVEVRVLIRDDASTDSTEMVGRRLAAEDARVSYMRNPVNRGHIATYNDALPELTGDYCMLPLSADDQLTPGALLRATRVMDAHPEVGLTYGRDIPFRGTPPVSSAGFPTECVHRILGYRQFLERSCRWGQTCIQAPTVVVRTAVHQRVGGFLAELPHTGDTELWLRIAAHADVCELDAEQAYRRLHAKNMSLQYPPVRRLEEQKRAFDIHFDSHRAEHPEIEPLAPVLARTIATSAVWAAGNAFVSGDRVLCDEFLTFGKTVWPAIDASADWRRLQVKRWIGPAMWRRIEPAAARVKKVLTARPSASAEPAVQ